MRPFEAQTQHKHSSVATRAFEHDLVSPIPQHLASDPDQALIRLAIVVARSLQFHVNRCP